MVIKIGSHHVFLKIGSEYFQNKIHPIIFPKLTMLMNESEIADLQNNKTDAFVR